MSVVPPEVPYFKNPNYFVLQGLQGEKIWNYRFSAVSLHMESQGEFPLERLRPSMVVNSNGVASASFLSGGKERDCAPKGVYVRRRLGRKERG